jgi:hypothetical protein
METNFTPGPWNYSDSIVAPGKLFIVNSISPVCYVDKLADARLIAAAPDLLTALRRLAHPMADDEDLEFARDVLQALCNPTEGME